MLFDVASGQPVWLNSEETEAEKTWEDSLRPPDLIHYRTIPMSSLKRCHGISSINGAGKCDGPIVFRPEGERLLNKRLLNTLLARSSLSLTRRVTIVSPSLTRRVTIDLVSPQRPAP